MQDELDRSRVLPLPDSAELRELFSGEVLEAYRFLYNRRENPPTMGEWVDEAERVLGKANVHTQRRLRSVRDYFVVPAKKQPTGGDWTYHLLGWKKQLAGDAGKVDATLEAEVYEKKGRFCAMCGIAPPAVLQIDHIIPRSWGGETVFENLEPLCAKHNNGKRNFFATLSPHSEALKQAIGQPDPWTRIGELLKAFAANDRATPVELIMVVARETNKGDPLKRLRELRYVLGWTIVPSRHKENGVTTVEYELVEAKAWPAQGARAAVSEYERRRRGRLDDHRGVED